MSKLQLKQIWKIFGSNPQYVFKNIDKTNSQKDVLAQTGHVLAVRDVSLNIDEGEIFVVMGLSGSGKSTLIRCISRLIEPTAGQVVVNQKEVTTMGVEALRTLRRHTISMVFQRFGLFPHQRVIDNVGYGLEIQGMARDERRLQARQVLDLVGLNGWENHFPHELSGGMQQRVGLARALAVDPEILLCDEPFSALDPLIRRDMQNELLHLQKTVQKTIVFITHDFLEALKLGDRVAIMKDGEIVQVGTPQEIVAKPVNDYVRDFTQDVPKAKVLTAESIMTNPQNEDLDLEMSVSCTTTLEALIPQVITHEKAIPVVNNKGAIVGVLDRRTVLLALAEG